MKPKKLPQNEVEKQIFRWWMDFLLRMKGQEKFEYLQENFSKLQEKKLSQNLKITAPFIQHISSESC